jgi:hypothetical protein
MISWCEGRDVGDNSRMRIRLDCIWWRRRKKGPECGPDLREKGSGHVADVPVKKKLEGRVVKTSAESELIDVEAGNFGWGPVRVVGQSPVPTDGVVDSCHYVCFRELKRGLDAPGQQKKRNMVVRFEAEQPPIKRVKREKYDELICVYHHK